MKRRPWCKITRHFFNCESHSMPFSWCYTATYNPALNKRSNNNCKTFWGSILSSLHIYFSVAPLSPEMILKVSKQSCGTRGRICNVIGINVSKMAGGGCIMAVERVACCDVAHVGFFLVAECGAGDWVDCWPNGCGEQRHCSCVHAKFVECGCQGKCF